MRLCSIYDLYPAFILNKGVNLDVDIAVFLINYFKYIVFAKYSAKGMNFPTIFLVGEHIGSLNIVHPKRQTFSNINLYLSFGVDNIPFEELFRLCWGL